VSSTFVNSVAVGGLYATLWVMYRWVVVARPPWIVRVIGAGVERLRARFRTEPPPTPPILFALELRRLSEDVRRVSATEELSKAERLAVAHLAYDLALRDYCRSVDLPVPEGHGGLSRRQRFELESALISAGYDW
jgi:hypothetical protein